MSRRWLLVEDDDIDFMTVERALGELGEDVRLERVVDGRQALERLRLGGAEGTALILLDLNMPRMSGLELLHELKGSPAPGRPPVVVWSTSSAEREQCLLSGAAGYFVKGVEHDAFLETMRGILSIERSSGRKP